MAKAISFLIILLILSCLIWQAVVVPFITEFTFLLRGRGL